MNRFATQDVGLPQRLAAELRDDLAAAAAGSGCEIVEARFHAGRLQIVLDHPEGVTLSHCEEVSRKVSSLLDALDFGDAKYVLEVSSPGLDRKLYGPRDFERFQGHRARVTWIDPERGKRTDVGRIEAVTGDATAAAGVRLGLDGEAALDVALEAITEARLEVEV